jgi:Transposase IS66 family
MQWQLVPIRTHLGRLLRPGASCKDAKAEALYRNLLKLWPALLTFAMVPGVEPTNNRAERALRGAVLWRKGCSGNQSNNGSHFTERILTTVAILRQQTEISLNTWWRLSKLIEPVNCSIFVTHGLALCRGSLNDYIKTKI